MTPREALATVSPETTLLELAELLAVRHFTGAPVLSGGALVGVVSGSDLMHFVANTAVGEEEEWDADEEVPLAPEGGPGVLAFYEEGWSAELDGGAGDFLVRHRNTCQEHSVDEIMSRHIFSIAPDATLREAALAMRQAGVHRLLVMEEGVLCGMISATDIVGAVADGDLAGK
jgi:CBS domain-containing protein